MSYCSRRVALWVELLDRATDERFNLDKQVPNVLLHNRKVCIFDSCRFIHVEWAADLNLHAVALFRGIPYVRDELDAFVRIIAGNGVAACAQMLFNERHESRVASCSISIA